MVAVIEINLILIDCGCKLCCGPALLVGGSSVHTVLEIFAECGAENSYHEISHPADISRKIVKL